ncbi:DUF2442 domain-containing protein [Oxalobacteraceae bacterium]|nr:DUF2442 domain-containing protein [Oxalobacteraceae bacterium]
MDISDTSFAAANRRAEARKKTSPAATAVHFDERLERIVIVLASGLHISFAPKDVQGLKRATAADLVDAQISPSGLGVHFPKLDADIYIPSLLEGFLGSKSWMASQMGKVGGKASTDAKVSAARANGKLGGRPRKIKDVASN